jgi:hypothetical protein
MAGPMTLAASSLRASRDARNELIATHLAEEGVEVIHNIRDNNASNYTTGPWYASILPSTLTPIGCDGLGCAIDISVQDPILIWPITPADPVIPCGADCSVISQVYYNPDTGLYRQSATPLTSPWITSPFKRTIVASAVDNAPTPQRQIHLVVTVTYLGYGNTERKVVINDDIYNWFPPLR